MMLNQQTGSISTHPTSSTMDVVIASCSPLRKRAFPFCWTTTSENQGREFHVAKRRKTKKSVQFGATTQGPSWHVTKEDDQRAWHNAAEHHSFKDECRQALRNVDAVKGGDLTKIDCDNKCCLRGLEDQVIPRDYHMRRKRKRFLIQMVLGQQDLHRQMGTSNPQKLHVVCELCSKKSKDWALELAALDAAS